MKGIWKYSHLLPKVEDQYKVSLGEGDTPLIKSRQIGQELGLDNLYFKLELVNPSGSYKDRFAASAVSAILQEKTNFCIATSSGNTGSALAAYSAMAGIKCFLAVVDGAPTGKLQQMLVYGSEVLMIKDFGKNEAITEKVMRDLAELAKKYNTTVQISAYKYSPLGMAGVQTIAYEIAETMGSKTDHVFTPAGGGGLTLALMKGFEKWKGWKTDFRIPTVNCVQPYGNNTIAGPIRNGLDKARGIVKCESTISGLQVPNIIDGNEVVDQTTGIPKAGYLVHDLSVFECQRELARKEGVFCEPAGAVSLAGLKTALIEGKIKKTDHIVCLVTGHGSKDPISTEVIASKSINKYFNDTNEAGHYIDASLKDKGK